MDKKTRPIYMRPTSDWKTYKTEIKGMEKDISCKKKPKKPGVPMLISDTIDFKTKAIIRDKEWHYIMIKGSIQEDITIYTPNIGAPI